jgi:3-hydroxyisobutyrate dehydrogenase-like beta-hydroxyacid dehydrogenase
VITRVGFIGLGKMGGPMARNILKAGFRVVVYDVADAPVRELVEAGAAAADSPAEAARGSEVVFIMVQADQVGNVLSGDQGVLSGAAAGTVVVDGGNCDPTVSRRYAAGAAQIGVSLLDAGCSGGPHGAAEGSLAIMVGGDEEAFARCLPVFQAVGGQIAYMGPSGNGHLAKVVNNMITKMTDFVIAESLTLGLKAGLDVAAMLDVLTTGAARSWILSQAGELFHEEEESRYQPTFTDTPRPNMEAANQLIWGVRMAGELGVPVPMAGLATELMKSAPSGGRSEVFRTAAQLVYKHAGEHIDSPPA